MNEKNISPYVIIAKFARIVNLWQQIENQPRKFGIEEELHKSEIHLIEIIGENEGLSVTDVSKLLGITKGAVSQTLKKLEKKGLISKINDPENSSRLLVKLNAKGKIAFYAHEHWHETMDGGFKNYFTNLPEDKIRFLDEFLSMVEMFFEKRI